MTHLHIPDDYPLAGVNSALSDGDTMFEGSSEHYLSVGLSALRIIEEAVGDMAPWSILDLPCGFGRVTRVLRARFPRASMTVCDIDAAAVAFSAATFGARGVRSGQDFRELALGRRYDLIWVGSLLTHMPQLQTLRLLDFAVRHMHADSRLVVTTHGTHVATRMRAASYGLTHAASCALIAEWRMRGYGYRGYDDSEEYGVSLISRGWFETVIASSPLVIQSYQPRAWDRRQDALVLRLREGSWLRRRLRRARSFEGTARPLATDDDGALGFDETWYLATYPDVAAAVACGQAASGLLHYLSYGWREGRGSCPPERTFEGRTRPARGAYVVQPGTLRDAQVDEAWSNDPAAEAQDNGQYWMAHPSVRARVNRMASGDPSRDAYDRLAELLGDRGWTVPIGRAVSLGCGFGGLERDLYARGIVSSLDAYDLARGAIAEASRQATAAGMTRLRFHVADLDDMRLTPNSVDVVFAHSSVHHVERLEALYETVHRTLQPGGFFHLNEFVGPTRFQWTDVQLEIVNTFLDGLPERLRMLPSGLPKERLRRPTIAEMIAADPTESVRSSELVGLLAAMFDIVEMRTLGGTILHLALGGIAQNFDPADPDDEARLAQLFAIEDAALAAGTISSDFAVIIARPREDGR